MPEYKLTYFGVRGRAELIRYLFIADGKDFEDCKVNSETWKELKPKTSFGQLPILEVDGKQLAQGYAIARYLAREFDMAGSNSWEQALCDQYIQLTEDLVQEIIKAVFEKDEEKKKEMANKLQDEILPKFMGLFEKALKGEYLVGNKLTVADLAVLAVFDTPVQKNPTLMDKFTTLKAHREKMLANDKLKAYIKDRPQTDI